MKQVVLNLLSNAVKFTPRGGEIRVSVGLESDGGVALSVRDTGRGMSREEMELSLQPFGQAGDTMTRDHEGNGMGLSLSQSLCKLHDGYLHLESAKGLGTTVSIHLPKTRIVTAQKDTVQAQAQLLIPPICLPDDLDRKEAPRDLPGRLVRTASGACCQPDGCSFGSMAFLKLKKYYSKFRNWV
ncbi:MAG: ATP-binding protein [Alphaproteobacteria bacterium]